MTKLKIFPAKIELVGNFLAFPPFIYISLQQFVLSIGGLILLFCGIFIDPQGQIHETLLVAFGETATFAGALFGIDYVYKKKK